MSNKANPTVIGLFIVVGLALSVGAVLMFSSPNLFVRTRPYIIYFDATLTGLDPGTPVKFRGVTVGLVKDVLVHFNQAANDTSLPVLIEFSPDLIRKRSDASFNLTDDAQLEAQIQRGLRAKLDTQSLLTGLLYVNLEFLPAVPAVYRQVNKIYKEIPTAPVEVQLLRMDFSTITTQLTEVLRKLDASLGELAMRDINRGLTNLLASLDALARTPSLTNTVTSAQQALDEVRTLSTQLRSRLDSLGKAAEQTLSESRQTMTELKGGIHDVRDLLAPQAPLRRDLGDALEQLSEAARSVAVLADFLREHPNALVTGRKQPGPEKAGDGRRPAPGTAPPPVQPPSTRP